MSFPGPMCIIISHRKKVLIGADGLQIWLCQGIQWPPCRRLCRCYQSLLCGGGILGQPVVWWFCAKAESGCSQAANSQLAEYSTRGSYGFWRHHKRHSTCSLWGAASNILQKINAMEEEKRSKIPFSPHTAASLAGIEEILCNQIT